MQCNRTEWAVRFLLWISFGCICASTFSQNTSVQPGSSKSGSSNSASALVSAKAEISKGELDSAEEKLWSVLSSNPNQPEALTLLGLGGKRRVAGLNAQRHVLADELQPAIAHQDARQETAFH